MNSKLNILTTAIALTTVVSCGGSTDDADAVNTFQIGQANLASDAGATSGVPSLSLAGATDSAASYDLYLADITTPDVLSSAATGNYTFTINDVSGASIPADDLSVALEIAASGNFSDAYRIPLFDLRPNDNQPSEFTARSAPVDLPSGSYQARLVVNPSWRHGFDIAPVSHSHRTAFHYLQERDYGNNASSVFQVQVNSTTSCVEDGYENNDNHQSAQPLPVGGQIDAALCSDNIDIYSVQLASNDTATIAFHYADANANLNNPTRYIILDSSFTPVSTSRAARDSHKIEIQAPGEGDYYLALFGARSEYRLTRFAGTAGDGLADDFADTSLFTNADTLAGPNSWLLGQITLTKLAITEQNMLNQTVNCGRITTQYRDDAPVAYVTPQHFADIHEFQFLDAGQYLVDGEMQTGWSVFNEDLSHSHWYENEYPGYAERVSDERWRYWTSDGLAYVECSVEL